MSLNNPAQAAGEFWKKHKRIVELFLIIYLFGLIVHLYMFTNKFFNYFELGNIFADMSFTQGDTIAQGRWFLPIATNLFTSFSMPLINGLISLFYVTASAVMTIDLLKIRSRLYALLFGFAFVSFPGYACTLSYGVNADAIAMGILLCVLAVYLYQKWKFGFLPAMLLIGCGLGAYQTYLSLSIGLIYMLLFFEAYEKKITWRPFVWKAVKAGAMLAGGFIVYYGVLQLSTVITGVSLTDYHGVDSMTSFTLKGIAKGLVYTYGYFLAYFFSNRYLYTIFRIACNLIGGIAFFAFVGRRLALHKKRKNTASFWMLLALFCLLPLGVNATPFLMADRVGAGVDRYMIPSIMFLWAMLLKLMDIEAQGAEMQEKEAREEDHQETGAQEDAGHEEPAGSTVILQWAGIVSVAMAIISSVVICNESYHRMDAATQVTTSYLNRIAVRLEAMPQWQQGMPVYFANTKPFLGSAYDVEVPAYDNMTNMPGTEVSPHYNERGVAKYFRVYLHMPIADAGEEKKEQIENSPQFRAMPAYPAEGSIDIIDDVIVIKLCESEEAE